MAAGQQNSRDLLKAVQLLAPEEFDAFLNAALSLRDRPRETTLSARESRLIQRINRGIPEKTCLRLKELTRKRRRKSLTGNEHAELLRLSDWVEKRDAERAADLLELAKIRRVPIGILMKQMGIQAAPVHG